MKVAWGLGAFALVAAGSLASSGCFLFDRASDAQGPDGGAGDICSLPVDCGDGLVCSGGRCQEAGAAGLGGSCWANRDCGEELFCSPQGICAPTGTGGEGDPCATGAECQKDFVCEVFGFGGQCVPEGDADLGEACTSNSDCIGGMVCGPNLTCGHTTVEYPPFTGVECEAEDPGPFRAYFEVPGEGRPIADFYRLPFPNDARISANGELDMSDFPRPGQGPLGVDLVALYVDALVEDFEGFSPVAPVSFRFSGELEFASVDENSIHYVDITPGAAEFGNDRARAWGYNSGRRLYNCQNFLTLANQVREPLLSGHTYAAFLTTDIRSASAEAPVQDDDLAVLLGNTRPTGDEVLGNAWDKYQPFRDYLADTNVARDPSTIATAAVFTVMDATRRGEALAQAVENTAVPVLKDLTLCDGTNTSPCEDETGRGACGEPNANFHEIHGRYSVPVFQEGTPPYETPEDGGGINEVNGAPVQAGTQDVCFALTIPKAGMAPANGWPLTVFAHGTGGSFTGAVRSGVAETLATAPFPMALFSFDGVVHGDRRGDSQRDSDSLMFNVINPRAARDNNLQGGVDVLHALRIPELGSISLPGAGDTTLDPANAFYVGHSQGSNVGIPAVASSNRTRAAVFSGAGAYLTRGILTKTSPVDAKGALDFLIGEELSTSHPVMVVWQTFFDSVDTLHYGPLLVQRPPQNVDSKNVFMSWGVDDTFSPQPTLNAMAQVARLPVVSPEIEDLQTGLVSRPVSANVTGGDGQDRTAACFQYDNEGVDGHFVALRNQQAIADWLAFLQSAIDGTPTVP